MRINKSNGSYTLMSIALLTGSISTIITSLHILVGVIQ